VHRDFKPDNVLLGDDGRVRVVDFGLALPPLAQESAADSGQSSGLLAMVAAASDTVAMTKTGSNPRLTQVGAILGTPGYMSPEQARGEPSDARSDQFSFCVALHEALHRQLPFAGDTFEDYAQNVVRGQRRPVPPTPDIPLVVERALNRGLSLDPDARFPSMQPLIDALVAGLHPETETIATRSLNRKLNWLHVVIVIAALALATRLGLRSAGETMQPAIIVAAALVVLRFAVSLAFRRQMRGHRRYERLDFLFAVATGYTLVGRIMGYVAGLLRSQYLTLELVGLAALMLVASVNLDRRIKWMALPSLLVSVAIQAWPTARPHIVGTYFPLLALSAFLLMLRAPTLPDDPPSDLPGKSPHK